MIGIICLIVYVVVAIMLIAYGNVVHKKHRFEDLWYKIGDDEAQCMLFSLLWPLVLCLYLPFKMIYLLFYKMFNKIIK
jgi:hypothetical protein